MGHLLMTVAAAALVRAGPARAQDGRDGDAGASRTFPPTAQESLDANKFRKAPPQTIGLSNPPARAGW